MIYVSNSTNVYVAEQIVLLQIDPEKLKSVIRYENLTGGEENFPHVYGELQKSAILQVAELKWSEKNQLIGINDFK